MGVTMVYPDPAEEVDQEWAELQAFEILGPQYHGSLGLDPENLLPRPNSIELGWEVSRYLEGCKTQGNRVTFWNWNLSVSSW